MKKANPKFIPKDTVSFPLFHAFSPDTCGHPRAALGTLAILLLQVLPEASLLRACEARGVRRRRHLESAPPVRQVAWKPKRSPGGEAASVRSNGEGFAMVLGGA